MRAAVTGGTAAFLMLGLLAGPGARAAATEGWLEPEEGVFAGYAAPWPTELKVRRVLLGDDHYRGCQLVTLPSFGNDKVVFIRDGRPDLEVVSRTIVTQSRNRSRVDTKTAPLDHDSALEVLETCEAVLVRTRYPPEPTAGLDGIVYHAGHWAPGTFLAGQAWSPKPGTIAREFVALEDALAAYAESPPERRPAAKSALLEKARALLKRVKAADPRDH
jgi:hypothetical protein